MGALIRGVRKKGRAGAETQEGEDQKGDFVHGFPSFVLTLGEKEGKRDSLVLMRRLLLKQRMTKQ
jgi:hypothetical protein